MPLGPVGFPPTVSGLTKGNGSAPDSMSTMALMSMLMGQKPPEEDTAGQLIEQVIQLLRKAGQSDPRLQPMTSDLLQRLTEGPPNSSMAMGGQAGMGATPVPSGGPGGAIP